MGKPTFRLLTSPIDLDDMRILSMGIHAPMPTGLVHRPHGVGSYLIAYFHEAVDLYAGDAISRYPPHSLILWEPDAIQQFGDTTAPWAYSWVSCDGPFVQATLEAAMIPKNTILGLPDTTGVTHFLLELHRELTQYPPPDPAVVQMLLQYLCVTVQRQLTVSGTAQQLPDWATSIKAYMDLHFTEPITLPQLAEQANLSVAHFCRKFHALFEVPPIEYLTKLRMQMAATLLLDNNLTIIDIAHRTGYDNYSNFSVLFRQHHGMNAREMRKRFSGEAGLRLRAEEQRDRELARWLREGWQLAVDQDFSRDTTLDPRLQCVWQEDLGPLLPTPYFANIHEGCLQLSPQMHWTSLRWEDELSEELKVEVVAKNTAPDGLNLAIAISGDLQHGYRLCFTGYDQVVLETTTNESWEILHRCSHPLDPYAKEYRIVFWRSGNTFSAEVDGQRILDFTDPFALQGAPHRRFAIGRFYGHGSADVLILRVCTRTTPRYVDILEPGRVLLRAGYHRDAYTWFLRVADEHRSDPLYHEAIYLATLAIPDTDQIMKEQAFRQATQHNASPFYQRLLRQWALVRLNWGDIAGAVDIACDLATRDPHDDTPQLLAEKITTRMRQMSPSEFTQATRQLARLPLTSLRLVRLPLPSLSSFQRMRLRELRCIETQLTDLTPLQGMPLERLHLESSAITDLTPLTTMPLAKLYCPHCQIHELSPLRGISLRTLDCRANAIQNLAPLAGMPLERLDCSENRIESLSPLTGMPLHTLNCSRNLIPDLIPLRGMALHDFRCSFNRITDLMPLIGMPLHFLVCAANQLTDLSPINGMPLRSLQCHDNAITDLAPLTGASLQQLSCGHNPLMSLQPLYNMPLKTLSIEGIPLHGEDRQILEALPLQHLICDLTDAALELLQTHPTLQGVNHHTITYLRQWGASFQRAIDQWRHADTATNHRIDLQACASVCGIARYLAVPLCVTRQEAEAFSHYYDARLVCPTTAEQYAYLVRYLTTVMYPGSEPRYHLGLDMHAISKEAMHWLTGEVCTWQFWYFQREYRTQQTGTPCFLGRFRPEFAYWERDTLPDARHYVVLEWPMYPCMPSASSSNRA